MVSLTQAKRIADEIYMYRDIRPARLRVGLAVFQTIANAHLSQPTHFLRSPRPYFPGDDLALYGFEVVSDRWLPADVWRLTDEDDTLLWDCRMPGRP